MPALRNPVATVSHGRTPLEALGFIFTAVVFVGSCGFCCYSWHSGSYDYQLQRGERVMHSMMGEENLESAGFFEAYPEGRPSDFMEFLEAEQGESLWPPTPREFRAQADVPELARDSEQPLTPEALKFVAYEVDPGDPIRQIVYIPNDEEGVFDLRGYVDPTESPIHTWTLPFPTDAEPIDP